MYHEVYQHASNLGAHVPDAHHLPCLQDSLQTQPVVTDLIYFGI